MELAGVAKLDITPPVGTPMQGFVARLGVSEGVHDPLFARALFVGADEGACLLITCDLIGLPFDLVQAVKARLQAEVGLLPAQVLVCATHTHSGPGLLPYPYIGQRNEAYLADLVERLVEVGKAARANAEPAFCQVGKGSAALAINRRGTTLPSGEPLVDPEVLVVEFRKRSGAPLAVLFNYACHAVVLGPENLLLSRDYPGYAVDAVEAALPSTLALFINGANADLNPHERGTFAIAERLGHELAEAVLSALQKADTPAPGPLTAWSRHLPLATRAIPAPADLEAELQERKQRLQALEADSPADQVAIRVEQAYLLWLERMLDFARRGIRTLAEEGAVVQVLTFGEELALAAFPGETLTALGLEVKALSPFATTLIASNANGYLGYLPPEAEFDRGGYEVNDAHRYGTSPGRAKGAAELLAAALERRLWLVARRLA